ncbi:hypothetical protein T02_6017 [Trichinella nativa]|uniref:KANL2-like probable zinc-finger domain-containing protein n=1 Tax=Trichinella nativa TaxID=6335 RepID=A0A0V1LNQ6_9BILA|nr:hypothetical protein T02_6017 [Trichinella nativa]
MGILDKIMKFQRTKMNLSNIKIKLGRRALVTESTNAKSSAVRRAPGLLLVKTDPARNTLTNSILRRHITRPSTLSAKLMHAEQQRGDPFENVRRHFKELISRSGNSSIKKQHTLKPIARFPQASSSKVLYLSKAQIGRKLAAPSGSSILERIKRRQPVKKKRGRSKKVRAQPPSLAADQMQSIVMEANDEDEKVQMCQYPGNECDLPAFGSVGLCINHAPPDSRYGLMQCRYPMDSSKLRCPKSISLLHSQTGLCEEHEEVSLYMELDKRKDARRRNARYIADKELELFMEYLKKPKRNVKRKQDTSPLNNTFSSMDESSETESEPEMEIMKTSHPVPDLPYHCLLEDDGPFRRIQILTRKEVNPMVRDYHIQYENTLIELAAALTMKYQLRMVQSGWQGQEETSVEDRWNISVEKCQNSSRVFVRNQSEVLRYMSLEKDRLENTLLFISFFLNDDDDTLTLVFLPFFSSTCAYEIFGQRICDRYALPLLNYCDKHAYVEKKQHLFKKCTFPKCTVSAVVTEKYCSEHALITRLKSPNRELTRDGIKAALEKNDEELLQKLKDFGLGSDFLIHLRRFRTARFPYQDWKALAEKQRGVRKMSDEYADSNIQCTDQSKKEEVEKLKNTFFFISFPEVKLIILIINNFAFQMYSISVGVIFCLITVHHHHLRSASAVRLYLGDQGVVGWLNFDSKSPDSNVELQVNFTGLPVTVTHVEVSFHDAPFLQGDHDCSSLAGWQPHPLTNGSYTVPVALTSDGRHLVNEKEPLELAPHFTDRVFSVLVRGVGTDVAVCANWLDDAQIYLGRFYGSQVAGPVYVFSLQRHRRIQLLSLLVNGENSETQVGWSIRRKWWPDTRNGREPSDSSCRLSAEKAPLWFHSTDDRQLLQPDTEPRLVTVDNVQHHLSELTNSVLVIRRADSDHAWRQSTTLACASLSPVAVYDGLDFTLPDDDRIEIRQQSPFHPVTLTRTSTTRKAEQKTTASIFVPLDLDNKNQCESEITEKSKLNLIHQQNSTVQIALDVTLYGDRSIMFHKLEIQTAGAEPACYTLQPANVRTAVARFFYPALGVVKFHQLDNHWQSTTWIVPDVQMLFDLTAPEKAVWEISEKSTGWSQEEMACSADRDLFDPAKLGSDYCLKAAESCPIGSLNEKYGELFFTGQRDQLLGLGIYATELLPLNGPFSIIGNTLSLNFDFASACANITLTDETTASCFSRNRTATDSKVKPVILTAHFDTSHLHGEITMVQYVSVDNPTTGVDSPAAVYYELSGEEEYEEMVAVILDTNDLSACNSEQSVYNPFYIRISQSNYTRVCRRNKLICAIGDFTLKSETVLHTNERDKFCVPFMPLHGPYSVSGKVLLLKSVKNPSKKVCALLEFVEVKSVNITADRSLTVEDILPILSKHLQLEMHEVDVQVRHVAVKYSNCEHYTVFVADNKNNNAISNFLSPSRWSHFGSLLQKLRPHECVIASSSSALRMGWLWVTACIAVAFIWIS